MDLNPGGIIGGLLGGGIVGAIVLPGIDPNNTSRGVYRLPIFGVIGGAILGNYLWGLVFPPKAAVDEDEDDEDDNDERPRTRPRPRPRRRKSE